MQQEKETLKQEVMSLHKQLQNANEKVTDFRCLKVSQLCMSWVTDTGCCFSVANFFRMAHPLKEHIVLQAWASRLSYATVDFLLLFLNKWYKANNYQKKLKGGGYIKALF